MKSKEDKIKAYIKQYIEQYVNVCVDDDRNLFCSDYNIRIVDVLYVFRALEDKLGIPVAKVLEKRNYTVFTVNNLVNAIVDDFPEILDKEIS